MRYGKINNKYPIIINVYRANEPLWTNQKYVNSIIYLVSDVS